MLGKNWLWAAGAVVAGLMLPSQAMAQYDAHTATDLNLRVGPGLEYGVIDVIPAGYPVDVLGCLDAYEWCDIDWDGLRGWVSARYLVQPGTTVYLPQYAPRIGVPIISFSFFSYHDRYYRDRPWYRERRGGWDYGDWRDRDDDWDRDDRDDDRDDDRERAGEREQRQEAERPRQQRDVERPRRQRDAERPRQQRDAERPRQQRDAERPRQQRDAEQPRQQREARPQQQQEREAQPQQGERTQRQGDRAQRGQREQRGGPPEELRNNRGQ